MRTQEHGTTEHDTSSSVSGTSRQYDKLRRGKSFYAIKEVVATGLCSRQTLWRLMKSGEIGCVKVGARVLIASTLGHSSARTTERYMVADVEGLRRRALDVSRFPVSEGALADE